MSPDDIEIRSWKTLFSPIARRSDDRLMLANHLFEIFDCLQSDVVLFVAEIEIGSGVGSLVRNYDFDRLIRIGARNFR